jgi:Icc-related predicted phosphoesterase
VAIVSIPEGDHMPFKLLVLSDIHGKVSNLISILAKAQSLQPDLVVVSGDITHFATRVEEVWSILEVIGRSGLPYCYVLGNCDPPQLRGGIDGMGMCLESNCFTVGGFSIIGAGGSAPTPFGTPFETDEQEIIDRLEIGRSKCQSKNNESLVIVTHNPPRGHVIDKTRAGSHVGSPKLLKYILEKKPILAISGHIHEAAGAELIGDTTAMNPGPALRGSYALVEIDVERRQAFVHHGTL